MKTPFVPTSVADRLYAEAARLERAWAGAGLADDFGSRMIEAVVVFLNRQPRLDLAGDARFAVALLRQFWAQNARRDAGRRRAALRSGTRPRVVSLQSLEEDGLREPAVGLYAPLSGDGCAGEWGRAIAQALIADGLAPRWAWAFVWRESGCEWEDVAFLVQRHFRVAPTPAALRKWGSRNLADLRDRARALIRGAGSGDRVPTRRVCGDAGAAGPDTERNCRVSMRDGRRRGSRRSRTI